MWPSLLKQSDYLQALCAVAFACLAATTLALGQIERKWLPWRLLFGFGLGRAVAPALAVLQPSHWEWLSQTLCPALAWLLLGEFGGRAAALQAGCARRRWPTLVLAALAVWSVVDAHTPLGRAALAVLAVGTGLGAALALLTYQRASDCTARPLRVAIVALALESLLAAAAAWPGPSPGWRLALQALGGVLAALAAGGYWSHAEAVRASRYPSENVRRRAWRARWLAAAAVAVLLTGWVVTERVGARSDRDGRAELLALSKTAAATLDLGCIQRLLAAPPSAASADYQALKHDLAEIRTATGRCRCIYIMRLVEGQVRFVADSEPEGSTFMSPPGELYKRPSAELVASFANGQAFVEGPLPDEYGNWVSGLVPLHDPRTGAVLALFGQDIDSAAWQADIQHDRRMAILVTLLLAAVLALFVVAYHRLDVAADRLQALDSVVERGPARVVVLALDRPGWPVTFASTNLTRLVGAASAARLADGTSWLSVVHPEDRPALEATVADHLARGDSEWWCEYRVVADDGQARWVRDRSRLHEPDGSGRRYVQLLVVDVTAQRSAQDAAAAGEAKLRALYDSMTELVVLAELCYDTEGRPVDYRLLDCNAAYSRVTGIPADQAIGALGSVLYGTGEAPNLREYAAVVASGVPAHFEIRFEPMRKDFAISAFRTGARTFGTVSSDVTARRQADEQRTGLERQLLHVQKLESLGILAGGIAHDFNNLLTSILGHADLARMELSEVAPARAHFAAIETAARRAADLCRQMLAYAGKGRFMVEALDLSEVVAEMGHILEVSVSKKALLRYHLPHGLPAVEADVSQVRQVLMNLIINASEAIGERSGVISVITGAADCDEAYLAGTWVGERLAPGMYVTLEVSDTGCGMDEATRERIFDPFYTTKFTGRGLGLAAVLGIVRGHGGTLKVYSEPGRGTTFRVLLPASANTAAALARADEAPAWLGHGTVLLADDEETVRAVGSSMLKYLGFDVVTAADGRAALDAFRRQRGQIVAVLLDLTMPHLDGEETFRELRQLDPDVRVVLTSGYNEQEVVQRFVGKGLAGFLQKPYSVTGLSSQLRKVLGEAPGASDEPHAST